MYKKVYKSQIGNIFMRIWWRNKKQNKITRIRKK